VFTRRGWKNLPDDDAFPKSHELAETISPLNVPAYLYKVDGGGVPAGSFNHPRAPRLKYEIWHKWARQLLKRAAN
jgi:hypothetical protein